ncbi:hypothetical protein BDV06DRAFT_202065 [Aspergillus oleicola]
MSESSDSSDSTEMVSIYFPGDGAIVAKDDFEVEWDYDDYYYEGDVTIELHEFLETADNYYHYSTTAPMLYWSTTIDEDVLPTLTAGESSVIDLWVYTTGDDESKTGMIYSMTLLDSRQATVTVTHTATPTPTTTTTRGAEFTPIQTYVSHDETYYESEGGGLSTGAKAGVGVGAGVGGLLLLVGGFFLFRRWQKQRETPKTIREISAAENPSASAAFLTGNANESGSQTEASGSAVSDNGVDKNRPVSLPVVVSPVEEDRSVTGRQSGERFELGG